MKATNFFFLFCFLMYTGIFAQETFMFKGKTVSKGNSVEDVHIVNISTSEGTLSSDLGLFQIKVSLGDTLLISSVIHERKKIKISKEFQSEQLTTIVLTPKVVQLDEMKLTGLTGNLEHDLQQLPADTIPQLGWQFSHNDLRVKLKTDNLMNQSEVNAENFVNPIQGGGAGIGLPDKRLIREQRLKRTLKLKKEFPDKLINEFGISYFTVTLGIKKEEIPKFISFCEPFQIFEKFYKNQILEVIETLKTESKHYHELED